MQLIKITYVKLQIKLIRRQKNQVTTLPISLHPLLRQLYTSRGIRFSEELNLSTKKLLPWYKFSGMMEAVGILYEAYCKEVPIVIIGDFDVDGATSTALSVLALRELGFNNVEYIIPNRFEDGYGLSSEIVKKAHTIGAKIIITVDSGISSHFGVNYANNLGIKVLITDHHLPGDKLPDAEGIVNPNLGISEFNFRSISGVGITLYLMLGLRAYLRDQGCFKRKRIDIPNIAKYLDLVALGTIADMVPLDANNRILIWQGLSRIRAGNCRPGIKALLKVSNCNPKKVSENDLSFELGPRLNAAGRLEDMNISMSLLLCENFDESIVIANKLNSLNKLRKSIERDMHSVALSLCESMINSDRDSSIGLAVFHPEWHQGVIGILASRIKERFHSPVFVFAPAEEGTLKGSGRSIQGINIYKILKKINEMHPGIIIKFGGHEMAAGLSISADRFKEFQFLFRKFVMNSLDASFLSKTIISDGPLKTTEMTIEIAEMLREAGPWGQMFPEPIFDGYFQLIHQKLICERHLKIIVKPIEGGPILHGIAFNIDTAFWPNNNIQNVILAYKLSINEFHRHRTLQLIIINIWPI